MKQKKTKRFRKLKNISQGGGGKCEGPSAHWTSSVGYDHACGLHAQGSFSILAASQIMSPCFKLTRLLNVHIYFSHLRRFY